MAKGILLIAQFEIRGGRLEELKEVYSEGIETVREKEPFVSSFNMYVSPDEKFASSVEMYDDSEGILKHFELSRERIPRVLELCKVTNVEVYGDVSDEVRKLLSPFGTKFYNYSIGL